MMRLLFDHGYRNFSGGEGKNTIHITYRVGITGTAKLNNKYTMITYLSYMPKIIRYWSSKHIVYTDLTYHYLQLPLLIKKENKIIFYETGFVNNFMLKNPDIKQYNEAGIAFFIGEEIIHKFYNLSFHLGTGFRLFKNFEISISGEYDLTPYCEVVEAYGNRYKFRFYNLNLGFQYYFYEKPFKQ